MNDHPIFFSPNTAVVNPFGRKFDNAWMDTANFANDANSRRGAGVPVFRDRSAVERRAGRKLQHPSKLLL